MKLKQHAIPIAVILAVGLTMTNVVHAAAGKALSFVMINDIFFFPDNDNDGNPDCDVTLDECFTSTGDIPVMSTSADKLGVPDAGSGVLDSLTGRGLLNIDQACVSQNDDETITAKDPAFPPPCPPNDTYEQVTSDLGPGFFDFPNNNDFARADGKIDASEGFVFPGFNCPADGLGVCGVPGNFFTDVTSIAEVQTNQDLNPVDAESDIVDNFTVEFGTLANNGVTAVSLTFELDWCREARLVSAHPTSNANAQTNANFIITDAATGIVLFDAAVAGISPEINDLNDSTVLAAPVGGITETVRDDPAGNAPVGCFPRTEEKVMVSINTNPDNLSASDCNDAGTSCFISEPDVFYNIQLNEGTDANAIVWMPKGDGAKKWYFGKQNPPFNDTDNMKLPFPKILSNLELNDQFGQMFVDVIFLNGLMTPAGKNEEVDPARTDHWSCYKIAPADGSLGLPIGGVPFETQNFGPDTAQVRFAEELCVSAMKNGEGTVDNTAFKCYIASSGQNQDTAVLLDDQFNIAEGEARPVQGLSRFCTPAGKDGDPAPPLNEDINDPATWVHKACYDIPRRRISPFIDVALGDWIIEDAFGQAGKKIIFSTEFERRFCEPAIKLLDN